MMASYYSSLSNQTDVLPAPYLSDRNLETGPEPPYPPSKMMYLNQASAPSFPGLFCGSSLSHYNPSVGAREVEMEFIPPTSEPLSVEPTHSQINDTRSFSVDNNVNEKVSRTSVHVMDGEQNLRSQGLSLSLGTRIPSAVHLPSFNYQYTDLGTSYNTNEMHSNLPLYEPFGPVSTIFNSKYLKAAQQLLDEVVNVQEALKQFETNKHGDSDEVGLCFSKEIDAKMNGNSSDPHESANSELSPSERQDLQNKLSKLLSMLDEVDSRYRQYYHQMQIVESSFEMVAGRGAAKPYTSLALKTISRHFRTLRDAVNSQIRVIRKNIGEQDAITAEGSQGRLPRLRYVDQQLRQQRGIQQFGVMRNSWRPQRGLPESSVTILRAWLFEHFLHPYPKDSEKLVLARQTGLSRSQVANWFINARVRLWKPMVEEMYKEEFGEVDFKSSPEHGHKAERLQESATTNPPCGGQMGQFDDSKSDLISHVGLQGCTARLGFENESSIDWRVTNSHDVQKTEMDDRIISSDGNFPGGKQVSLALGLQHCEMDCPSPCEILWYEKCNSAI